MFARIYLVTLPIFFAVDMLWLAVIAKDFYQQQIGHLMRPDVNWQAAITFYLLFIFGLVFFIINPALEKESVVEALWQGALFGFIAYATYDLTNLAVAKDWPLTVTIVDMVWGAVLSGSVCGLSYWANAKIGS